MTAEQINITLGTAGHIDHGKTALVKLLTGCETDRLKEEKERGMSIELGFAPCQVAGLEVGIVDVPGHEHFIKTMVAGATGIDACLVVVAADDGIMPQTREHLDILTLLGVRHGMVALTKIDRVTQERVETVRGELASFLRGTFLEGAPIAPISSITGEGFDGFYKALATLVKEITPRSAEGVFRLPVERTFSVKGYGTVVTGIPVAGSVDVGDEVVLLPAEVTGRVNAIQVYSREAQTAKAGQCAALNVRHWERDLINRGDVVTLAGYFAPEQWYVCRLRVLPHETISLKNGSRVKFHTGTLEVPATLYVLEGERLKGGQETFAQLRVDAPVVAGPGDGFILRSLSPVSTIGGGRVVEASARKLKRNHPSLIEALCEHESAIGNDAALVEYVLRRSEGPAVTAEAVARSAKVLQARAGVILSQLVAQGKAMEVPPGLYMHEAAAADAREHLLALVGDFHDKSPEVTGIRADSLQEASGLPKPVFEAVVASLTGRKALTEANGRIALAGYTKSVSQADRSLMDKVEAVFKAAPYAPPSMNELTRAAALPLSAVERAVTFLKDEGRLVAVAPGMLFHSDAVDGARKQLVEFIEREGKLESVKFKYLVDTTRKFAIPLLDYFDKIGVTLRVGNTRYLKGR